MSSRNQRGKYISKGYNSSRREMSRPEGNISDAETSEGQHSKNDSNSNGWKSTHDGELKTEIKRQNILDASIKEEADTQENKGNQTLSKTLTNPSHPSSDEQSIDIPLKKQPGFNNVKPKFQSIKKNETKRIHELTKEEVEEKANDILEKIQLFDYESQEYQELKRKFYKISGPYISLLGYLPRSLNKIGDALMKNGIFHDMWSKIVLKGGEVEKQIFLQQYYVEHRSSIQKNLQCFQRTFNPIPEDDEDFKHELTFKRYRNHYDDYSNSTTKMDCMILFQQVKAQMKKDSIEQSLGKRVENSIKQWREKSAQEEPNDKQLSHLNLWFENEKAVSEKWDDQQEQQRRQQKIKQIEQFRARQKSPLSNRFRMMHECQTNQRRFQVEMACLFLKVDQFYFLNDLEIVKIQETVFSENQEIIVLKAYTVDLCPENGMLKIEPKVKNLIAAYKFCGLTELIRFEKTYGKFDGIIVYPQSFDIQKYFQNSKELTLIKDECRKQVKQQIVEQNDDGY